jgi:hypothetical protein
MTAELPGKHDQPQEKGSDSIFFTSSLIPVIFDVKIESDPIPFALLEAASGSLFLVTPSPVRNSRVITQGPGGIKNGNLLVASASGAV